MDYIALTSGITFLALSGICFIWAKKNELQPSLSWLSASLLLWGLSEWVKLAEDLPAEGWVLAVVRIALYTALLLCAVQLVRTCMPCARDCGFHAHNHAAMATSGLPSALPNGAGIGQRCCDGWEYTDADRKWAEEALCAERAQLLSIFDSINQLIYVSDPKTHDILYTNEACKEICGKEPAGLTCYKEMLHLDHPCSFCTADDLQAKECKPIRWQRHDPVLGRDFEVVSRIIKWSDGRTVRFSMATDVTEQKRTTEAIKKRLAYEKMLAEISIRGLAAENLRQFQNECMELIGKTFDVSRAYIFERRFETRTLDNTVEWVAEGISPQIGNLQGYPEDFTPWWMKQMESNQVINFSDIEEIPGEGEKEILRQQDIKSILVVPLFLGNTCYGFVGFDECRYHREWPDEDVEILKTTTRVITEVTARLMTHEELQKSEANYRAIFDTANDAIIVFDTKTGRVLDANRKMCEMFEYDYYEARNLGAEDICANVPPYDKASCERSLKKAAEGEPQLYEWLCKDKTGRLLWVEVSLKQAFIGDVSRLLAVMRDISERKQAEASLRMQISAINAAGDQIIITDPDGIIEFVNPAFEKEMGYTAAEVIGRHPKMFRSGVYDEQYYDKIWTGIREGKVWHGELISRRKDGSLCTEDVTVTPVSNEAGEVEHFIAIKRDITEKKLCEEQLDKLAHHDALTGLPNRLQFSDRLVQELAWASHYKHQIAVMFLDIDRFKLINDTLGHSAGDRLLKEIANRLTSSLRNVDTVARMGGDEFTLIITQIRGLDEAEMVAERALDVLRKPFALDGQELFITASLGISLYPSDGSDVETLVREADTAMYLAKEQGRNTYRFYTQALETVAVEKMALETSLRKAVDRDELLLHYQPRVDIRNGSVLGMEALVRWQHPELGLVIPAQFIPLAEETGLIVPVSEWVLRAACRQNKEWQDTGLIPLRVGVNISACQFHLTNLVETIGKILDETGLDPHFLDLELTESALMLNPEHANKVLCRLKEMGVSISLDDFGTGYSSLSQLKLFPVDAVKIDQSFIANIATDPDDAAIAGTVVAMAHSLKLKVIAEGVETLEQLEFLRSLGCDEIQGYFVGRPVPAEEFVQVLEASLCDQCSGKRSAA